ncbi:MAG: HAD family hydrolase [Rickettsiales bacterium]|nr:HAD family hydrolase [Rickettsiales bacterium]
MSTVLVFDLDDTLFLEKQFVLSGFKAVDSWLAKKVSMEGFYDRCLNIYNSGVRGKIFNEVFDKCGVKYTQKFIDEMVEVYRLHQPKINLLDEAKEMIEHFFQSKHLSIITDGYWSTQQNKIIALNINGFFDYIVYSDSNGRKSWKPSQWPYLEIMKRYNKDDANYVYVADNVLKDFITAKKLGWKTIHVLRPDGEYALAQASEEYQADHKIGSLRELKQLII